jgi:hypothetical protein
MEFMSPANWALISKRGKECERITGYRGVILSTTITPKTGIDLTKSEYSKEDEIILLPGTYEVDILDIKTFKDILATSSADEQIERLYKDLDGYDGKESQAFLDYIILNYKDQIKDDTKHTLFKMLKIRPFSYDIKDYDDKGGLFNRPPELDVSVNFLYIIVKYPALFLDRDVNPIIQKSKREFLKMLKDIEEMYKPGYVISWGG